MTQANRRGQATAERIRAAALDALAQDGLDLTIDDVARRAGTTRMTVYRHVGTREDLLVTLVLELADEFSVRLEQILDGAEPFPRRVADTFVFVVMAARRSPNIRAVLLAASDPEHRWSAIDTGGLVMTDVLEFLRPRIEAGAAEVPLRADVDESLNWLLRQLQLYLLAPPDPPAGSRVRAASPGHRTEAAAEAQVRHEVETFVLPALFVDLPDAAPRRGRTAAAGS